METDLKTRLQANFERSNIFRVQIIDVKMLQTIYLRQANFADDKNPSAVSVADAGQVLTYSPNPAMQIVLVVHGPVLFQLPIGVINLRDVP
jgi:hypothetical protein